MVEGYEGWGAVTVVLTFWGWGGAHVEAEGTWRDGVDVEKPALTPGG
jgi:hypothetical protein